MVIHFVCRGNVYRSRLAEAYLSSKQLENIKVISSGIKASDHGNEPISWLAQRLLGVYKLVPFEKSNWTQTSKQLLDSADRTIFFGKNNYEYCVEKFKFSSNNFEIWEIADLDVTIEDHSKKIKETEETFKLIKKKVDDLISRKKF